MPNVYKRPMKAWFNRFFQRFFKSDNKQHGTTPVSYFAHIPKTAGTSFIVLLDRFYAADKIYPHQLWREVKHIDLSDNDHYDLFRGHFGGGGLEVLTQRAVEFFTLLRDPIALAQSTYQFVKRESNTKVHQLVEQQGINFAEFLSHPMTAPLVQNRMTRYLSFDFVDDPAAQEVFLSAETIEYLQSIIQKQGPGLTDEHRLKRAQNFIHHSRWFGLLERFDESLQLLCFEMHWPPMGETQKLNTFKKTKQLTPEEQQLIKQLNPQDNALYAYAAQVVEQRLMDMHQQLKPHQTHASQTINELLDISYQQHQSELISQALPNGLRYTFEQVLLGSQWHRREVMQPENEYFRWTGPASKAGIDFWL